MKEDPCSYPLYFPDSDRRQPLVFRPKASPVPTSRLEHNLDKLDAWITHLADLFLLPFLCLTASISLLFWLFNVSPS